MTPEEVAALSSAGLALSIDVAANILSSILFGIGSLACCLSLYIYFKTQGNARNAKKAMICVLFGDFVLMLILVVSSVAPMSEVVKYSFVVTLPGGILEQIAAANSQSQIIAYNNIFGWSSNAIQCVADAVIVWRAWAVWMDNTKVKWTLLLLMLANIAVSLADSIADDSWDANSQQEAAGGVGLDWVTAVLSASVNMIATCSIAFRAWLHHKSMNSMSIRRKKTQGERILLLLLESGAIYMIVQLLVIITAALDVNRSNTSTIGFIRSLTTGLYISAANLNPVIIFILVQTQNTYDQSIHLEEILTLSQQTQLQQVSVILNSSGTPADVGSAGSM
ncbi:hypothetical protein BDP27DRAFT_1434247 [Rhodocollybia butyracea]|uniref:Uncharacterized protein n=1 Tax=Rhodocollybia butyracea TaxID=206335 RepID=A0A9P5P645_9AGAR|nr:hypothetical protein BDP27DRAFT_1434247 [Rhodocollybia butyracea]